MERTLPSYENPTLRYLNESASAIGEIDNFTTDRIEISGIFTPGQGLTLRSGARVWILTADEAIDILGENFPDHGVCYGACAEAAEAAEAAEEAVKEAEAVGAETVSVEYAEHFKTSAHINRVFVKKAEAGAEDTTRPPSYYEGRADAFDEARLRVAPDK